MGATTKLDRWILSLSLPIYDCVFTFLCRYDAAEGFTCYYDFIMGLEPPARCCKLVVGLYNRVAELGEPSVLPAIHTEQTAKGTSAMIGARQPVPRWSYKHGNITLSLCYCTACKQSHWHENLLGVVSLYTEMRQLQTHMGTSSKWDKLSSFICTWLIDWINASKRIKFCIC